jgi:hypothetical protein
MIVHSEMPSEKSSAIVTGSEPLVHGERVMQCIGATGSIVGRMNSDKCRPHRPMQGTSAFLWGDDALRDFQFGCTGGSRAADGGASVKRRTGRKEKPYQDNSKKPKGAKFHRREVNLTRKEIGHGRVSWRHAGDHLIWGAVVFIDWLDGLVATSLEN